MKIYIRLLKSLLVILVLSVSLAGCSEDAMDRINEDRDHAHSVDAKFIITEVITATAFSNVGGDFNTYTSSYIEYEVGVDNQLYDAEIRMNEPSNASTFNNAWNNAYRALKNARIVINQCKDGERDAGNYVTKGIAEVLAAYNSALITDLFGNAPFSQAAVVDKNGQPLYMTPKIDKQEDIYKQVMQYLDDAIVDLQKSDMFPIGNNDLLYGGKAAKWLKFAYGLKARYTMRLLNRTANQTETLKQILEYLDASFIDSPENQAAFDVYDGNNINPLFGFFEARGSLALSQSLCEKLAERNDPRIYRAVLSPLTEDGIYQTTGIDDEYCIPAPNGQPEQSMDEYGTSAFMYSISAPTLLLSYHELKFLQAEALCRLNREPEAKAALKDAVVYGLLNMEKSVQSAIEALDYYLIPNETVLNKQVAEDYFDENVAPLFEANPLKETMIQKYLAFWGASGEATEMFSDIRRWKAEGKDFIDLKNTRSFPLRCPYGSSDVIANPEVKAAYGNGQYVYTEPVWWANGTR